MKNRTGVSTVVRVRRGMSLAEVIVAMTILTGVLLVLGGFSAKFSQASAQARLVVTANEIAASRLDELRNQSTYASIDLLASPPTGDTIVRDYTKYARVTSVARVGGTNATDSTDFRTMTVTVSHPSMLRTVTKTTSIAAF